MEESWPEKEQVRGAREELRAQHTNRDTLWVSPWELGPRFSDNLCCIERYCSMKIMNFLKTSTKIISGTVEQAIRVSYPKKGCFPPPPSFWVNHPKPVFFFLHTKSFALPTQCNSANTCFNLRLTGEQFILKYMSEIFYSQMSRQVGVTAIFLGLSG